MICNVHQKLRTVKMIVRAARMEKRRGVCRVSVGIPEGKSPLEKPRRR
jgi:hypothetical protein